MLFSMSQFLFSIKPSTVFAPSRFDVILDSVGGETEEWVMGKLKPWSGAKYVTLITPLLHNTDSLGLLDGAFRAVFTLNSKVTQVQHEQNKLLMKNLNSFEADHS